MKTKLAKQQAAEKVDCIPNGNRTTPSILSYAQQRLWFLDQLLESNDVFNMLWAMRLKGVLNIEALNYSFNEVVKRHEVLRTSFKAVGQEPIQIIRPFRPFQLNYIDLLSYPAQERENIAQRIMANDQSQPFNLQQEPLFRPLLIRLDERDHIMQTIFHHIISDAWSRTVFTQELESLYKASLNNTLSPLANLPIQYADYSVWQRSRLQSEKQAGQLKYWKEQLANLPELVLPADYSRLSEPSYRGAREHLLLSNALFDKLKTLGQTENATLFMTLLATFQLLLYRHSEQETIIVGSPIAGRNRREFESLIGLFTNTLVFRMDLSGSPTYRELLGRVRKVCLSAYANQDFPFEKLVAELQPQRDFIRQPFFNVLINFFDRSEHILNLPEIECYPVRNNLETAAYPITLYIVINENGINLDLVYQTDLYSQRRIAMMLDQFRYLLEQISIDPDQQIGRYSLLTPASQSLLPDPKVILAEPAQPLVHHLFLEWAIKLPDKIAISQGNREWSYAKLSQYSRQLANLLQQASIKKGDVVAVTGSRSPELIACILGILMRGGVMLTIDNHLPQLRKQLLLKESDAKILFSIGSRDVDNQQLEQTLKLTVINIETGATLNGEAIPLDDALLTLHGDDPAYIFFTSGSTGVPKGVLGRHKSLGHFIVWQRKTFHVSAEDRVSQLTGFSFDVILRDIFLPLSCGATLCLPKNEDMANVPEWLQRERISIVHTVPTLLENWLLDLPDNFNSKNLKYLFISGEPLTGSLVQQWRMAASDNVKLVNLYGATETTLIKCFYTVPNQAVNGIQPIGAALPQTQVIILSPDNRLCGLGEAGEIVIRTPFSSLGYINDGKETSPRFVKNFFRDDDNDILYFTGDRGRYRPDGLLEILGRLDDQIKIHGVRVEPSEVAAFLSKHEQVRSCAVVALKKDARNYLAAYVVIHPCAKFSEPELTSFLIKQLPRVMVPEAIVLLHVMPRLSNGKIDRRSLPEPDLENDAVKQLDPESTTIVENELLQIWQQVLNVEHIGIDNNFFDLGGHSLLAFQVMSRIKRRFQIEPPLRWLFETSTLSELAKLIENEGKS